MAFCCGGCSRLRSAARYSRRCRAAGLRHQITTPVTDSVATTAHDRGQDAPRQAQDAAGMQREPRLHEQIRRGTLPREPISKQAAVAAVAMEDRPPDTRSTMTEHR
jgi:hypothetical protein